MSRQCEIEGCNVKAYFNYKGSRPGVRCGAHRLEGQVNIYDKTCAIDNCTKRPLFNTKGERNGLYCKSHKTEGMVDVKNNSCVECDRRATHNYRGMKGMYCSTHAKESMEFSYKNECQESGCHLSAKYYSRDRPKTGKYCAKHKKTGMIRS